MVSTYTFVLISIIISFWQRYTFQDTGNPELSKDYGVHGGEPTKLFGIFNGIVIMSFAYGNTIIPEIQVSTQECRRHAGAGLFSKRLCIYMPRLCATGSL